MPKRHTLETLMARFPTGSPGKCWPWQHSKDACGYGSVRYQGRGYKAHRLLLILAGNDMDGKDAMHACDNPSCCNPAHLRPGTRSENNRDASIKGRWPQGKGKGNVNASLTDEKVRRMRAAWAHLPRHPNGIAKWRETAKMAKRFGVTDRLLYRVGTRQVWKHVP